MIGTGSPHFRPSFSQAVSSARSRAVPFPFRRSDWYVFFRNQDAWHFRANLSDTRRHALFYPPGHPVLTPTKAVESSTLGCLGCACRGPFQLSVISREQRHFAGGTQQTLEKRLLNE